MYKTGFVNSDNVKNFSKEVQELYEMDQIDSHNKMLVIKDDISERYYMDGGEPEDNLFNRDWYWVIIELDRAYLQGLKDGQDNKMINDEWINVDDKMPENEKEEILISVSYNNKNYTKIGWVKDNVIYWTGYPYQGSSAKVTYWKSLPQLY